MNMTKITKPIRVFQYLPNKKVKLFAPQTGAFKTIAKDVFETILNEYKDTVYFIEHKPGDIMHEFSDQDGFTFSLGRTKAIKQAKNRHYDTK